MENNQPIKTPETNPNPAPAPVAPESEPKKDKKNLVLIIVGVIAVLVIAVVVVLLVLNKKKDSGSEGGEETTESVLPAEGEIGEVVELQEVLTDYDSQETYIDSQEALINSGDETASFDGRLDLAGYYISVMEFDRAEPLLVGIDTSSFSTEQYFRYYNVLARYYEGVGDTGKRDEANALSAEYRNRLQSESGAFDDIQNSEAE